MSYVIEPAQTIWSLCGDGVARARLRVPKGSTVLAMEANHLLVQRPVVLEFDAADPDEGREWLELVGIQLGVEIESVANVLPGIYLGVMRLTQTLASYAVFAPDGKQTISFWTMNTTKTYGELIADLDAASIALRYCTDAAERPALIKAKSAAESAIEAFNDAEADQDLANGT